MDPAKQHRYEKLARGPFFAPVVAVARAYLAAAVPDPATTQRDYWALSCLPGTTPRRLSAVTMRITDALVIYKSRTDDPPLVKALVLVERSTLEAGFGCRDNAQERHPHVRFADSTFHGAGPDQMIITGYHDDIVAALRDEPIADAARQVALRIMGQGRVLHWRGHNDQLASDVLDGLRDQHAAHRGRPVGCDGAALLAELASRRLAREQPAPQG